MRIALKEVLGVWRRSSLNLLFPPSCRFCGVDLYDDAAEICLCSNCLRRLAPAEWPHCQRCGAALSGELNRTAPCPRCRNRRLWFDHVVPLGLYAEDLRLAILRMKHRNGDPLSNTMGDALSIRRGGVLEALEPDLVVAVPMYWTRRVLRGTNCPEILAGRLAERLGTRVAPGMLYRSRNTLPQNDLPPGRRFQNVRGAFGLRAGYDLRDMKIVIVDDVLTTGATCSEVARVLKEAGAATVVAAVLARAEGPESR